MNDRVNAATSGVCAFDDWRYANARMVDELSAAGLLDDPRWHDAFSSVPRHVFVPRFLHDSAVISCSDPATADQWRASIYTDTTLITQTAPAPRYESELPTSSSTLPSLMAHMLNLLEIDDNSVVLEIGTATGYNTAVLCHVVGDHHVTTVELHPELSAEASKRLSSLGMRPTVASGDGRHGHAAEAPFGRIISTCAANSVPAEWVQQLAPGGRIVTDLRTEMSSSLAVLDKIAPDRVEGRLLDHIGNFMWLRPDAASPMLNPTAPDLIVYRDHESNHTAATSIDPRILGEPGLRIALGVLEPTLRIPLWLTDKRIAEEESYFLYADDGSWCDAIPTDNGEHLVTQGGPRRVWDSVQRAVDTWHRMGEPDRGQYGVTITTDGAHAYWVDEPTRLVFPPT
ncbi:MAG: methyltransferase domain-containing protein [Pseudonocardia sp.]